MVSKHSALQKKELYVHADVNVLGQCLHSSRLLVPSRIHTMTIDNKIPPIDAYNMCIHAWLHTKLTSNSSFRGTHTDRLLRLRHTWSLSFLRACIHIINSITLVHVCTCTCTDYTNLPLEPSLTAARPRVDLMEEEESGKSGEAIAPGFPVLFVSTLRK